jgi:DmsE family decaheme c-type cytochrome
MRAHLAGISWILVLVGGTAAGFVAPLVSTAREMPARAHDICAPHCDGIPDLADEIVAYLAKTPARAASTPRSTGDGNTDLAAVHAGVKGYACGNACGEIAPDTSLANEIADYLKAGNRPRPPTDPLLKLAAAQSPGPQPADGRSYVGQQTCAACHTQEAANWAHTIHAKIFGLNPRNQLEREGCEACHGPGSVHVANPAAPLSIVKFSRKSQTPIGEQNAQCLVCHRGGQRIFWQASVHETHDLGCSDCHNPMANFSLRGLQARASINETCMSCHKTQRAEFRRRSHMPLLEGKVGCTDCHNPHGSTTSPLLKANSVNETCYNCHAEKRGPFLFEHAPVRDNCVNCHTPHGSNNEKLLAVARPILCQQCHAQSAAAGHATELLTRGAMARGPIPDPRLIGRSCLTCHSQIHGSNSPSGARFER